METVKVKTDHCCKDKPKIIQEEIAPRQQLKTYFPLILIFSYLIGLIGLKHISSGSFYWDAMMTEFMGGFFLIFSFFKFLNLKGFAEAYKMYDRVAKQWG